MGSEKMYLPQSQYNSMDVILHKSTLLLEKIRGESKGGVGLGITQELFIVF